MVKYIKHAIPKCEIIEIGTLRIRYLLDIELTNNHGGSALCIMMNPSRADMTESDYTVNGVVEFFNNRNYKTIKIFNLIPLYVTDSSELRQLIDDFQKETYLYNFCEIMNTNFSSISEVIKELEKDACVVLAWGDPPEGFDKRLHQEYVDKVLASIESLPNHYIFETNNPHGDITKLGNPRHPSRNRLTGLQKIKIVKYRHIVKTNCESSNKCNETDAD